MLARSRSLQISLLVIAVLGPILYLAALLARGLELLNYSYPRLGFIFAVLALSAGAAAYMAAHRGNPAVRLAALGALVVNLASVAYAGWTWSNEMQRAFVEVEMVPFELDKTGILVCPADHTPREMEEARALEDTLRAYAQGAGLAGSLGVRPCYPVESPEAAKRLGRELRANVVVWKEAHPVRNRLEEIFHITVLGTSEAEIPLRAEELLLAMASQGTLSLRTSTGLEKPSTSPYIGNVVVPVATGFGFWAAGEPRLAATQLHAALEAPDLPQEAAIALHNNYGLVMLLLGRLDLATQAYDASQALAPNGSAWVGLGMVAIAGHEWDLAAERFSRAIHLDPYDASAYCGMGVVAATQRDVPTAMRAYRQAVGLDPTNSVPYALLALAHELGSEVDAARQQYHLASLYAGPNNGLVTTVERRAEEIRRNPPTPVPTSTPRPTPSPTPIPTSAIYQIQKGDTLKTIADKFGVSVNAIVEINGLSDPNAIDVGQTLLIPQKP